MPGHLNVFEPYERKAAHHEDALTRAFLVVLRSVPVAHGAWLQLVDQAHRRNAGNGLPLLHELVQPEVHMQTARVPAEAGRVVSVVQTDEHVEIAGDAKHSDRRQVLDGVVGYGELAVVIENKPWHGNIWTEQLDVNIPEGAEHDPRVACVAWKDIVLAWARLLESGHLSLAETVLVGDFLDYVEHHFPGLRPYSRVGLCGDDHGRLARRCKAVLTRLSSAEVVDYHRGWGWYIDLEPGQCARKIGLLPEPTANPPRLVVEIDPGDTMGQARIMYRDVSLADIDALLRDQHWHAWPNFHLMFMTSGFFRPGHRHEVRDYWTRWASHQELLRRWSRDEFERAFVALRELDIVRADQRADFDQHTVDTARPNVYFAPGVTLQWWLPLDEAARLDDRDQLEATVRSAIEQGAAALRLRWPRAAG